MITPTEIKQNEQIRTYIEKADEALAALGYTEHSYAHVTRVAHFAEKIMADLGYEPALELVERLKERARKEKITQSEDNRIDHAQSGAVMAFRILDKLGMPADEIATVCSAIGNHDEGTGVPVNAVAAALILADKADVRRSRVRNQDTTTFDIHDRVNYSVKKSTLKINEDRTLVKLKLTVDTHFGSVMDYFEIFMQRMILCRKAAEKLGLQFKLIITSSS